MPRVRPISAWVSERALRSSRNAVLRCKIRFMVRSYAASAIGLAMT